MDRSSQIFIDGKEVQRLEGKHKERKAYAEAFKKLKEQFRKFKVVEHIEPDESFDLMLTVCENILNATPPEKLSGAVAQIEVSLSTITGRRVVLGELHSKIEEALKKFRETRTYEDFFRFKALFDQYRSLLNNHYREIRLILGKLKMPAALLNALDFRYLLRVRSKLISRNVDEDSFSVIKAAIFNRLLFTLNRKFYEQTIYRGNHRKLGSLLQ
jgi:hypothetical protein